MMELRDAERLLWRVEVMERGDTEAGRTVELPRNESSSALTAISHDLYLIEAGWPHRDMDSREAAVRPHVIVLGGALFFFAFDTERRQKQLILG